jgi:ribosomal-protein-alanine N-acetyltransferase
MQVVGVASRPLTFPDPALADGELTLRPWHDGDGPALVAAGTDPVVRHFRTTVPDSADAAREWLRGVDADRRDGRRLELAIASGVGAAGTGAAGTGAAVGSISIQGFQQRNAMIGYWLAPAARGRGLATRAVRLLAGWAFSELDIARLGLHVHPDNLASRRLAERCGFVREGRLRSYWQMEDGRRLDSLVYGLLPGDLLAADRRRSWDLGGPP